jgi:hypothetical protein
MWEAISNRLRKREVKTAVARMLGGLQIRTRVLAPHLAVMPTID